MAMHMSNDHMTLLAFINIFLCGLLFGLIFVERGNIWMVAALSFRMEFSAEQYFWNTGQWHGTGKFCLFLPPLLREEV